jgi:hypothetical protein
MGISLAVTHVHTLERHVSVTIRAARVAGMRSALGKLLWARAAVAAVGVSSCLGGAFSSFVCFLPLSLTHYRAWACRCVSDEPPNRSVPGY